MRPVFLSAFVVLAHLAIKAYDLVIALTGGGPGQATELPATFMYSYTFTRNQMGMGASSAIIMLIDDLLDHRALSLFRNPRRQPLDERSSSGQRHRAQPPDARADLHGC